MELIHVGKSVRPLRVASDHRHPFWELTYNQSGRGEMILGGETLPFEEGTVVLCPPQTGHYKAAQTCFEDYYVHFRDSGLPAGIHCFHDTPDQTILGLLRTLYTCYHETGRAAACVHLAQAVLALLAPEDEKMDKNVRLLRHILTERLADPDFRVKDAMAQIHLNGDHLRRCFKRETGLTPQAYLTRLRMENAKKMLAQSGADGLRVAEVAYLSGFDDPLYFSRVFRAYTGRSPRAWQREAARGSGERDAQPVSLSEILELTT